MPRWRDQGLHKHPFGIDQITRVTKAGAIRRTAVFRFPHRALPSRIKRLTRNHIRFIRLKNFPDRLLDASSSLIAFSACDLSMMRFIREINTEVNAATAPSRNAGAVT